MALPKHFKRKPTTRTLARKSNNDNSQTSPLFKAIRESIIHEPIIEDEGLRRGNISAQSLERLRDSIKSTYVKVKAPVMSDYGFVSTDFDAENNTDMSTSFSIDTSDVEYRCVLTDEK